MYRAEVRGPGRRRREAGHGAGRVRGPRLPDRLRLGRVPGSPARCAASPCPTGCWTAPGCPQPIFTPAIKAPLGEHDENVDFATIVAPPRRRSSPRRLRDATLAIYARAAEAIAGERGIILADTKFEFGLRPDGTLVLADEVLTPDSSRFWDAAAWRRARSQPSFDKQFVRDWLAPRIWLGPRPPTSPRRRCPTTSSRPPGTLPGGLLPARGPAVERTRPHPGRSTGFPRTPR